MGYSDKLTKKFSKVYKENLFYGTVSKSGNGSDLTQTEVLRLELPILFKKLEIKSILDLPCGDFYWMSSIVSEDLVYTGADVVPELISKLNSEYKGKNRDFLEINIVNESIKKYDAIFCRDLFVHLSNKDIIKSLKNIINSQSTYLFTTTFTRSIKNKDLPRFKHGVAWRMLNLRELPWRFPEPMYLINEKCTEGGGLYSDKSIGVWKIKDLPKF
jgi:2-polyprenyl-3-methyl-5-hydroxy-6-metoxy-1,4-benzoquinol methylase